jgi:hypothetical protein
MKKHTVKAKSKRPTRRPSRSLFNKLLLDLIERIDRQIAVTQAIKRANIPNGEHIFIEYQLRTVFGVMLDSQLRDLMDIQTRAGNLCTGDMIEKHADANSRSRLWT